MNRSGIPVALNIDPDLGRLPEDIELSIFRIVQEGLNNVLKHSDASASKVDLPRTMPRTLMLSVSDNGRGIAEDFDMTALSASGNYGLVGISERVALLDGRLKIQNLTEGGLLLHVEIPHPRLEIQA